MQASCFGNPNRAFPRPAISHHITEQGAVEDAQSLGPSSADCIPDVEESFQKRISATHVLEKPHMN